MRRFLFRWAICTAGVFGAIGLFWGVYLVFINFDNFNDPLKLVLAILGILIFSAFLAVMPDDE